MCFRKEPGRQDPGVGSPVRDGGSARTWGSTERAWQDFPLPGLAGFLSPAGGPRPEEHFLDHLETAEASGLYIDSGQEYVPGSV